MAQTQRPSSVTVLSIGDGDTIRVQQGQQRITIRVACIDAPVMEQAPDGAKARSYLLSRLRLGTRQPGARLRLHDPQEPGQRISRRGDPPADPALRDAAAQPGVHRHHQRQAAGGAGGPEKALAMAVKNHLGRKRYTKLAEWLG